MAELCTEFKCTAIKTSIRQALEAYKRQFWSSLKTEEQQKNADFSRFFAKHHASHNALTQHASSKQLLKLTD